jgi:hypothetical protein
MATSLKESIAARKGEQPPECFDSDTRAGSFIEFQPSPESRLGFALAQLLHYSLEANPASEDEKDAPPERLTLAFSTADVVILGARLVRLTDLLREHKLAVVRSLSGRYRNVESSAPWVGEIVVRRLDKSERATD